jgi:hypothetical protein
VIAQHARGLRVKASAYGVRSEDTRLQYLPIVLQPKHALDRIDTARQIEQPSDVTL